jgi:hypothetical protein
MKIVNKPQIDHIPMVNGGFLYLGRWIIYCANGHLDEIGGIYSYDTKKGIVKLLVADW